MIVDELGNEYASLNAALLKLGLYTNGKLHKRLKRDGFLKLRGHIFRPKEGEVRSASVPVQSDPLWERMKSRYSPEELKVIASGKGLSKTFVEVPKVVISGEHHRIVVISDTHIGSVYSPGEWHRVVADYVRENEVEAVLHCGDLVDGMKQGRPGAIFECDAIGYEAQRERAVELMGLYPKEVPIYVIGGNHDAYYGIMDANIVKSVCDAVPNMVYLGMGDADLAFGGCVVHLHHGGDGNSYSLSYRLQKCLDALPLGSEPDIYIAGHVHKFVFFRSKGIWAISAPALQRRTSYMSAKRLEAHCGFLVLDFDTNGGEVVNMNVKYIPFSEA